MESGVAPVLGHGSTSRPHVAASEVIEDEACLLLRKLLNATGPAKDLRDAVVQLMITQTESTGHRIEEFVLVGCGVVGVSVAGRWAIDWERSSLAARTSMATGGTILLRGSCRLRRLTRFGNSATDTILALIAADLAVESLLGQVKKFSNL